MLAPAPLPPEPEVVQLVLGPPESETQGTNEPSFYSEQPHDRADAAPKNPDFLSNVTSRAKDLEPGGDATLPRMQGDGDAPTTKLEPGAPARPDAPSPEPPTSSSAKSRQPSDASVQDPTRSAGIQPTSPNRHDTGFERPKSDATLQGPPNSTGHSDFYQPEMDNPNGNAGLMGQVSLNTTAWDYAPWLERFGRQLMRRWIAPPAYDLGILKDGGWALIEVEISPAGKMVRLELLDQQGHPSLTQAAESALRAMAPIEPLPKNFPEPTLILRLRMIYPSIPRR